MVDSAGLSPDAPETSSAVLPITRETLQNLAREHCKGHGKEELLFEVVAGAPLIETLRYAHEKDVDLIFMVRHFGQRIDMDDEATYRLSGCAEGTRRRSQPVRGRGCGRRYR